MKRLITVLGVLVICALPESEGVAADAKSCRVPVSIVDAAERKPGGALYKGPAKEHHGSHGSHATHGDQAMKRPEMKGAHMDHDSRHGGAFFMAPDKMRHLEAVFSERCGLQVFFYNAFTEPIRADRFRAFVIAVPESEDEAETIRFLSSTEDSAILETEIGDTVSRPFDLKLYVKFPESDEPELFTVKVKAARAAANKADATVELAIKSRKIAGSNVVRVKEGQTVELRLSTDEAVELHLHGYDVVAKAKPGASAVMRFKAHATGRYPVTIHGHSHGSGRSEKTLLYLEVHPN